MRSGSISRPDTLPVDAAPLEEGDLLDGKYRVERIIGRGAMGGVVPAWHDVLDQRVAIKLLPVGARRRGDAVERFLREARSAAQIQSQHVARVFDVGTLETGEPFIVMEYLEGVDLHRRLLDGPLSVAEAVDVVLQACE